MLFKYDKFEIRAGTASPPPPRQDRVNSLLCPARAHAAFIVVVVGGGGGLMYKREPIRGVRGLVFWYYYDDLMS